MFRLQRFFSGSSLIFIFITAVCLGLFYRYLSIDLLLSEGENKNVTTTRILANSLWPQMERLLAQEQPVKASDESRQLHTQVKQLIEGLQVVKIKLYQPSGMTVFSTDFAQVGQDQSGNPAIVLARQGKISNSFVERDHFNSFDQRYEHHDLLQTYMPLYRHGSDQVVGVFEVYTDYTPLLAGIARAQGMVVAGIGVILLLLYAALLLVVRHAETVIRRQDIQLRGSVKELVATQASLELRVAERTQTLQQSNQKLEIEVQQRERMKQIISDREQRLQAVMDNLLNAIVVCDEQGVIELINPSAEKLFGYSSREVSGQNLLSLFAEPITFTTDSRKATLQRWLEPLLEVPAERQSKRKNASRFPAEVAVTRFLHGAQVRYIVSFRDLSAQMLAEKALGESRQKLLHQEKMAAIGSLSSGIVHEIGNPIAAIDGLLQEICSGSAERAELAPEVKADLELIQQQVQRLISINRDVSEFSSPQGEVATLLDFNTLVGRTCRLMRYDGRMKDVKLLLDLDPKLPAMKLCGDQLIQVLMNLISNAVDAVNGATKEGARADGGEIWVRTRLVGQQLILSVQDNGTGMDPETVRQAVDAFFTTKAPGMGTGLGLSICDSIIAHHGGEMEIESALGRGTYVQVFLPIGDTGSGGE